MLEKFLLVQKISNKILEKYRCFEERSEDNRNKS